MRRLAILTICAGLAVCFANVSNFASAQSLDGTWVITSVIDNGRVVPPNDVQLNYAADGRVVINAQQVELIVPLTYQRKRLAFAADSTQSPMAFDLAGAEKTGGRGIFMASKDSLMLCLSSRNQPRPTTFSSQPGSGNLLITLQRATDTGTGLPRPPPDAPAYKDQQLREMLAGTWGHQDAESIHYMTLGSDGTVNTTATWKDQFKQLFHQDVHSNGTWQVRDGVVTLSISNSTDAERSGQTGSFRVRSITGSELVAVDYDGSVRQEWKAPQ
jgi:uncharacterized protein (TIGR03067 family)